MVLTNVMTYLPFMIVMSILKVKGILIAEVIIVVIEAVIYRANIKEMTWKDAFTLSLIANIVTVVAGILIKFIWFGNYFLI